mgnify:CR=1 FL=1|tara:strand:- start:604 stop:921 length:318 start_codon:yes stop_codon:yes gene_type:complete
MSHFAEIDSNGVVQQVIVAEQDFIDSGIVGDSFNWVQTSYNNNFRKQYAGKGHTYDKVNEVFVGPQPHPSWVKDANHDWQPPVARPGDADTVSYTWDEAAQLWVS